MEGLQRAYSAIFFPFLKYLFKLVFCFVLGIFAIDRLANVYGAGFIIGTPDPKIPTSKTQIPTLAPGGQLVHHSDMNHPSERHAVLTPSEKTTPSWQQLQSSQSRQKKAKSAKKVASGKPFEQGKASFYGKRWNGRKTASGEVFDSEKYTAAHKTLAFGVYVRVVRKDNGKSVIVRINDRGPFIKGRIIDLSSAAAKHIDMIREGVTGVKLYKATVADYLKQFMK